jgi:hypothetical protein
MAGIGPILAVIFIVACLLTAVAACAALLRGRPQGPKRRTDKKAGASSITADEVIDVHLALQEVTSLRELR